VSLRDEVEELKAKLKQYQYDYYITGQPRVSDTEYDRLFDRLSDIEEAHPELKTEDSPTMRVGSDLTNTLPEVNHTIPVLSLDKAYSPEEILKWVEKTEKNTGTPLSFVLEEKIDGISIVLYYEGGLLKRAVTRGNGQVGNDVTANVKTIGAVPLSIPFQDTLAVRGEIYLPKSLFSKINSDLEADYANPRNLAAGTIRRIKSSEVARVPLNIFIYEGFFSGEGAGSHMENLKRLQEYGFRLNPRTALFHHGQEEPFGPWTKRSFEDLHQVITEMTEQRQDLDYEIDGLVFKVDQMDIRQKLGYTGHHPRWAIAYKFESPTGTTTVRDIDIQVGRTGRITPVARVDGVLVGGATISNVTLHNQAYIDMLELSIGDRVTVSRRGDVIPAVEKVVEKNEKGNPLWHIPENCPSCGTPLTPQGAHHFCSNRLCPDQLRGRIRFFIGTNQMDIRNLGPETLEVLLSRGMIRDVEDLYTCDLDQLEGLEGFGPKKVNLIKQGLAESLNRPFETVLASLGIPELGRRVAELLSENGFDSMDRLLSLGESGDWQQLESIPGIGEKTARNFTQAFGDLQLIKQIEAFRKAGLKMTADPKEASSLPQTFEGQSWCITGSFEAYQPRTLAGEEIKARGGRIVSGVTSKTTHLLAGEKAGSKLKKAQELGVTVVSETEFKELLQ